MAEKLLPTVILLVTVIICFQTESHSATSITPLGDLSSVGGSWVGSGSSGVRIDDGQGTMTDVRIWSASSGMAVSFDGDLTSTLKQAWLMDATAEVFLDISGQNVQFVSPVAYSGLSMIDLSDVPGYTATKIEAPTTTWQWPQEGWRFSWPDMGGWNDPAITIQQQASKGQFLVVPPAAGLVGSTTAYLEVEDRGDWPSFRIHSATGWTDPILRFGRHISGSTVEFASFEQRSNLMADQIAVFHFEDNPDDSASGFLGAIVASATYTTGKIGKAGSIVGNSDYFSYSDNDRWSFTDGAGNDAPFSVAAWVLPAATGDAREIAKKYVASGNKREWVFATRGAGQSIFFFLSHFDGGNTLLGTVNETLQGGVWVHLAATYDGSEVIGGISLYVNGVKKSVVDSSVGSYTGMTNTTSAFTLGQYGGVAGDVKLDEAMIFDRELSVDEILAYYNQTKDGAKPLTRTKKFADNNMSIYRYQLGQRVGGFDTGTEYTITSHWGRVIETLKAPNWAGGRYSGEVVYSGAPITAGNLIGLGTIQAHSILSPDAVFSATTAIPDATLGRPWATLFAVRKTDAAQYRGDNTPDDSVHGTAGAWVGSSSYPAGQHNTAFGVSSGNYVDTNHALPATYGTGDFSLSCWVNPVEIDGTNEVPIWGSYNTNSFNKDGVYIGVFENSYATGLFQGKIAVMFAGTGVDVDVTSATLETNAWTHLLVVRDGSSGPDTKKLYKNGSLVTAWDWGDQDANGMSVEFDDGLIVGANTEGTQVFHGRVDEARWWTRALSAAEALDVFYQRGDYALASILSGATPQVSFSQMGNGSATGISNWNTPSASATVWNAVEHVLADPVTSATTAQRWLAHTHHRGTTDTISTWGSYITNATGDIDSDGFSEMFGASVLASTYGVAAVTIAQTTAVQPVFMVQPATMGAGMWINGVTATVRTSVYGGYRWFFYDGQIAAGAEVVMGANTPTVTNTPTNTYTPTNTPTDTPTPTNTPTDTDTPNNTPTDTDTPNNTPTNTSTSMDTPRRPFIKGGEGNNQKVWSRQ